MREEDTEYATWGCVAKVNMPINKKRNLGPKIVIVSFLGML